VEQRTINKLNVLAYRVLPFDGYGRYALSTIRELVRAGIEVYPQTVQLFELPGWMQRLAGWDVSRTTLSIMPPHELIPLPTRQWNLTMYESSKIPDGWKDHANAKAERLIVPCEWCADVFRANHVKIPIHVVHGGVDPEEFPVVSTPVDNSKPYVFMSFGDRGGRKGDDITWQAFYMAFGENPDVRLIVKTRPMNYQWIALSSSDRRVSIWKHDADSLADVFVQADCFVFPTKGEGWGLPPREAACMGKPVICTDFGGTAVGCENWCIPVKNYKMRAATIRGGGEWAYPDVEEVAAHMLWVYEHREEARQKGLQAAQWLRENQTWRHSVRQLINLMEQYA